jgi:hypothetical protein
MKSRHPGRFVSMVLLAGFLMLFGTFKAAQQGNQGNNERTQGKPFLVFPDRHDTSPTLWEMSRGAGRQDESEGLVRSVSLRKTRAPIIGSGPDTVLQSSTSRRNRPGYFPEVATTSFSQFEGQCNQSAVLPPDANVSIGRTQIVQTANPWLAIYDRNGTPLIVNGLGRVFNNFGGACDPQDPAYIDLPTRLSAPSISEPTFQRHSTTGWLFGSIRIFRTTR